MPVISVPDLVRASIVDDDTGPAWKFPAREVEVTRKQAEAWNRLNEKEQLTLVLKADREHKDVRDYL